MNDEITLQRKRQFMSLSYDGTNFAVYVNTLLLDSDSGEWKSWTVENITVSAYQIAQLFPDFSTTLQGIVSGTVELPIPPVEPSN